MDGGAQRLSGCGGDCSPRFTAQGDESDGDATFCSAQKRAQRLSDTLRRFFSFASLFLSHSVGRGGSLSLSPSLSLSLNSGFTVQKTLPSDP